MGARLALQEVLKLRSQTQSENPGFTTDSLCDLGQVAQPSWPQLPQCHKLWTEITKILKLCLNKAISPRPLRARTHESERKPPTC